MTDDRTVAREVPQDTREMPQVPASEAGAAGSEAPQPPPAAEAPQPPPAAEAPPAPEPEPAPPQPAPPAPEPPRVSPAAADAAAAEQAPDPFEERPEAFVAAAFAGGFVVAKLLGRLGR